MAHWLGAADEAPNGSWWFYKCDQYDGDQAMLLHRVWSPAKATHVGMVDPVGSPHILAVRGMGRQENGASWILTGTGLRPTLAPSILRHGGWHGYLRDGVFQDA